MHSLVKNKFFWFAGILLLPQLAFASEPVKDGSPADYNITLLCLEGFIVFLLFVIGMLAYTLNQLTAVAKERTRKERTAVPATTKTVAMLLILCMGGFRAAAYETGDSGVPKFPDTISGIPFWDFFLLLVVIALELVVIFALVMYLNMLLKAIKIVPESEKKAQSVAKKSWFWDKLNSAITIEKEKDIMLDHDYDGIRELDNSLPPWWKYGFYVTILVSIIYLYRYHISHDGQSQQEEFAAEMQKGEEDKAAYLAKSANNVDENSVTLLAVAELGEGKDLFVKNCAACHLADGGGVVGPNLTDNYWLHGGSLRDIFKSIKYGWQDKGMKSWKDDLSPRQIQQLASFIKSLQGTHPASPKAPQGDIYIEATDSKADTTKTVKVAIN